MLKKLVYTVIIFIKYDRLQTYVQENTSEWTLEKTELLNDQNHGLALHSSQGKFSIETLITWLKEDVYKQYGGGTSVELSFFDL